MSAEVQMKLQKIKKVSTILRTMCTGLLVLIALVGMGAVVCLTFGVGGVNYDNNMFFRSAGLGLGHRLILGVVCALTLGAMFKCFYHLRLLFGNYSRGEIFTRESVGQLRWFGIACLLWGVMYFVWGVSLALSAHPAKSFEGHLDSFGIGAVIVVIAWFMDMAVDLREENELTI
jgi:Protein of unknown function (DUF2975)